MAKAGKLSLIELAAQKVRAARGKTPTEAPITRGSAVPLEEITAPRTTLDDLLRADAGLGPVPAPASTFDARLTEGLAGIAPAASAQDKTRTLRAAEYAYRKGFKERGPIGRVAIPATAAAFLPGLAYKGLTAAGGLGVDAFKNLYGIDQTPETTELGFDPAQVAALSGGGASSDQAVLDALAQYVNMGDLYGAVAGASPQGGAGTAGTPSSGKADTAALTKEIQDISTSGGLPISTLTPTSGTAARQLEAAANQANLQKQYLDYVEKAAAASGAKLGADWRQRYMDKLVGEKLRRQNQVSEILLEQALTKSQAAQTAAAQGITIPDVAVLKEKAAEYNELDANTKALLAMRGINSPESYVNNYLKTVQPQG